jgi:hypothetical protein
MFDSDCRHEFNGLLFGPVKNPRDLVNGSDNPFIDVPICVYCKKCGKTKVKFEFEEWKKSLLNFTKDLNE